MNKPTEISLTLPWPPTVNTYWRKSPRGMYITAKGKGFAVQVMSQVKTQGLDKKLAGDLQVTIDAYVPDRRKRDLDNIFKSLFDALCKAGVFLDDSQIVSIQATKHKPSTEGGRVAVSISELD